MVSFGNLAKGRQLDVENAVSDMRGITVFLGHLADHETLAIIVEC